MRVAGVEGAWYGRFPFSRAAGEGSFPRTPCSKACQPNNAAHLLRLVTDQRRARAVADLIVENLEPAEAAATAFETEERWPGGGKAWLVEAFFGFAPDEEELRALIAAAAATTQRSRRIRGDREARLGRQFARRSEAGQGRTVSGPRRARPRSLRPQRRRNRDRGRLAFGTGHTARRAAACCISTVLFKRRRPGYVLDVGCGAGVLAIAAAEVLRRKVWLGDLDPIAVEVADANARLNGVAAHCQPLCRAASRTG